MNHHIAVFASALLLSVAAISQNRLALIVAVGEYPPESRLRPIAAVNDIKFIKAALYKNGFEEKNIDTLVNSSATKKNIIDHLAAISVKAGKNDIVVIHFGCHGQQIRDQKTIELGKDEDDGYDEALLPYDAFGFYNPVKYHGENHLRDDDLHPLLTSIREKIGKDGSLLVLIDACHSGTGTRADDFPSSRGEPVPFPDPENPFDPAAISDITGVGGFLDTDNESISNMVVFSGSGPHQENKQMLINQEEVGSLSYGFFKAMEDLPEGADYQLLFQKIKTFIRSVIPDQVPMAEGRVNQLVFSGKYNPSEKKNYIMVSYPGAPPSEKDSVFTLNQGMFDEVSEGVKGKIFPAGKNQAIASAVIRKVSHFSSLGVADKSLLRSEAYEFRPDDESYGTLQAIFSFKKTDNAEPLFEKPIRTLLEKYSFAGFNGPADFQFEPSDSLYKNHIRLRDRNNRLIWQGELTGTNSLSAESGKQLVRNIKQMLRIRYLRSMPDGGSLESVVSAEILPPSENSGGTDIILGPGDIYTIRIRNNSDQKLFYSVLDILPNDSVEIVYPYKGKAAAGYSIEKKSYVERKLKISAGSPSGTEILKIVVSKEPMEQLWGVFEQSANRGELNSFENMLNELFGNTENENSTRADIASVRAEEIGISTLSFTVRK